MSKVIASTPIMEIGKINKNNSIITKEAINNSPIVQDILNNGTTFIGEIQHPKDFEEDNNEY